SGKIVSGSFHNVLNGVIHLQDVLFKKPEPIPVNSTDTRWKWFKNYLGALDGTYIKIRVPSIDKSRYRTRKAIDIVEELCDEDVANERNPEEVSNENGCEFDVSLDEMDVSAAQSQSSNPNKLILHFKEEEKRSGVSEPIYSTSLIDATTSLEDNIRTIYLELSRSIAFEMLIQE
ncbi:hypothetical protein Goarm_019091, partial [Gossypium armourianum]|nr:hypothetical protein [Gossypium armourianum]